MGRIFYQTGHALAYEQIVHRFSVPGLGGVVIAMREPNAGERGYEIGVDATLRDAVRELLADWAVGDEPGWPRGNDRVAIPGPSNDTYNVTILAAWEFSDDDAAAYVADTIGRERCEYCKEFTDDAGECGDCVNCQRPLCAHSPKYDRDHDGNECPRACGRPGSYWATGSRTCDLEINHEGPCR